MAPRVEHRAYPLPDGRFKLVTVTTTVETSERVVDEAHLRRLGVPIPKPEVPWTEEPPAPLPPRAEELEGERSSFNAALGYWRTLGFSIDRRMPQLLGGWLDEFTLEGVLRAMHEVATIPGHGPPYLRLVQAFRRMREEGSR